MNKRVVPNVELIAREMTGSSQIGMILSRFMALSLISKIKLGFNNLIFLPELAKMDFAVGIKLLCELEILKSKEKKNIGEFVLHNQMVDMALALKNKKVFNNFFYLAKKYGFKPGLITYNFEMLVKFLSTVKSIPKDLIIYTNFKRGKTEYLNVDNRIPKN
ncbi:hypothetical protein KJ909_02270 [Patescibacteria group bacterium]|nr:hypothetical protein [Patescibacteria group bacterium]